jgi:MoxR-like ATPase
MNAKDTAERFTRDVHRIVVGQDEPVRLAFIALVLGGHLLIEGVPGTAKTLLARTIARLIGGTFKRIQFTPDLMPSDIIGSEVLEDSSGSGRRSFRFVKGPIFAQLLMADEINRRRSRHCCRPCRNTM